MNSTGERIRKLRGEKGLTVENLAEKIGCDKRTIHRYENNQYIPESTLLIKLACAFNVTTDYLLCLDEHKHRDEGSTSYEKFQSIFDDCKRNLPEEGYDYYLIKYQINLNGEKLGTTGFGSQWGGFTDETPMREIRIPRCVRTDEEAVRSLRARFDGLVVINNTEEAKAYRLFGGDAIIKKDICSEYFPDVIQPIYVDLGWEAAKIERYLGKQ
ncbi:MAG: helix-turn-helix domain-containing protein [Gudongella sp.]|nr:helix-turn-helix domain-containing protein [Gudongella sp.]